MMFYPAEDEKPPFHAEPEEGQVAPELPAGYTNEAAEEEAEASGASVRERDPDTGRFVAAESVPGEGDEEDKEDGADGEAEADADADAADESGSGAAYESAYGEESEAPAEDDAAAPDEASA